MKTHLDLFSGIGGFALAARWAGFETIGFCENENYPRRVLAKHWPGVRIHGDIRDLDGSAYKGVDLITGGYPCQPFSVAGQRKGAEDDRHLWPKMLRVVAQARPAWVIAENVYGHITMGLDQVLADLEGEGYAGRALVIPACAVDAPHRRDRVWIIAKNVANTNSTGTGLEAHRGCGLQRQPANSSQSTFLPQGDRTSSTKGVVAGSKNVADSKGQRRRDGHDGKDKRKADRAEYAFTDQSGFVCWLETGRWLPEPGVGRMAHGVSNRVDRLRGLGNAIVPQVAYQLIMSIQQVEPSTLAS